MYEAEVKKANYANAIGGGLVAREVDYDPTVEENIDNRIAHLKAELARLEESKKNLGPLLPMKISSIRDAMNY